MVIAFTVTTLQLRLKLMCYNTLFSLTDNCIKHAQRTEAPCSYSTQGHTDVWEVRVLTSKIFFKMHVKM